jgi:Mg-chelatase subunit ChlD
MLRKKKGLMAIHRYLSVATFACLVSCGSPKVARDGGGQFGSGGKSTGRGGSDGGGTSGAGAEVSAGGSLLGGFGASSTAGDRDAGTVRPGDTCAADTAEVKPVGLDIALLVDTSYSMDFELRWQYVKGALLSFVSMESVGDLGLSLQFFPLRSQCDVGAYALPAVPMANVADERGEVEAILTARRMSGGTPIVQALQGMGDYASRWAKMHSDRKTVVVLATDGVPDETCAGMSSMPPNDLPNAASTAKALADAVPSIPVFVIGVGAELTALDTIARAGGTDRAVLISDGVNAQKEFLDALRAIRRKSLACEYVVPDAKKDAIDFRTVNVEFTEGRRVATTFFYVGDADGCRLKPDEGWYYDDPAAPSQVILCPATCDRVAEVEAARIDIAYGCTQRSVR